MLNLILSKVDASYDRDFTVGCPQEKKSPSRLWTGRPGKGWGYVKECSNWGGFVGLDFQTQVAVSFVGGKLGFVC